MEQILNISQLPPDIRVRAEYNREHYPHLRYGSSISKDVDDINMAFVWSLTPQGHDFWYNIYTGTNHRRDPSPYIHREIQTDDQIIF